MSELQEKVWVVMKHCGANRVASRPVKVTDDRKDAREYAKRLNNFSTVFYYTVHGVKKG